MKRLQHSFLLLATALVLVACQSLGIPTPETFNQQLAVSYTAVTTVRQTATTLLEAKKLSPADAQNVLDQTNNVRTGLDIARSLHATNPTVAVNKLEATRSMLLALQAYLATKQAK